MSDYGVGYDVTGAALDYTSLTAFHAGIASSGDRGLVQYSDTNKNRQHTHVSALITKSFTLEGNLGPCEVILGSSSTRTFDCRDPNTALTIKNVTITNPNVNVIQFYMDDTDQSLTFERCRFVGAGWHWTFRASTTNLTVIARHCEWVSCYNAALATALPSHTITVENCGVYGFGKNAFSNAGAGTMTVKNTVCIGNPGATAFSGTITTDTNATDDGSPGTNGIDLRVAETYLLCHGNGSGFSAASLRPWSDSSPLVGAGLDLGLTQDIDGQPIDQSVSANVGPYGFTMDLASAAPDFPDVADVKNGVSYNGGALVGTYGLFPSSGNHLPDLLDALATAITDLLLEDYDSNPIAAVKSYSPDWKDGDSPTIVVFPNPAGIEAEANSVNQLSYNVGILVVAAIDPDQEVAQVEAMINVKRQIMNLINQNVFVGSKAFYCEEIAEADVFNFSKLWEDHTFHGLVSGKWIANE